MLVWLFRLCQDDTDYEATGKMGKEKKKVDDHDGLSDAAEEKGRRGTTSPSSSLLMDEASSCVAQSWEKPPKLLICIRLNQTKN